MTQITIDTDKLPLKKKLKCGCNILADWSLDHDNTILINIKPKCRRHKEEELKRYYTLTPKFHECWDREIDSKEYEKSGRKYQPIIVDLNIS